jgi:hypothetical protein
MSGRERPRRTNPLEDLQEMQTFGRQPWDEPEWLDRAAAWTRAQLVRRGFEPRGELTLERMRPWAAVAWIETSQGRAWFKEPAPIMAFEPALTAAVSGRSADAGPQVIAWEGSWLLTRDAGPQLRSLLEADASAAPAWEEILRQYAELQLAHISDVDGLLALRVPDKRPQTLLSDYPRLVEDVRGLEGVPVERARLASLCPVLERVVARLAEPVPITVIHEEVHEGNVFVAGGHARLLDWGEGAVSHPFAGLTNTLRDIAYRRGLEPDSPEILRLRDVYLELWTQFASLDELRTMFGDGYLLGMLCRAVTWERFLAEASQEARDEYDRNAAVWLDIFREGLEDGVRLGAS